MNEELLGRVLVSEGHGSRELQKEKKVMGGASHERAFVLNLALDLLIPRLQSLSSFFFPFRVVEQFY